MNIELKLGDVARLTEADVLAGEDQLERQVTQACAADLLSDVLALVQDEGVLLLTGCMAPQVLRIAEVLGLGGLLFVRGKRPNQSMCDYAREAGLPLLVTDFSMFEACGVLYTEGVSGAQRKRFPKDSAR